MKNYRISITILIAIILFSLYSTTRTKHIIDLLEAQVRTITPIEEYNEKYIDEFIIFRKYFSDNKRYLKSVINKDYIYDIEVKINLLESSLKTKDITSTQEYCIEIMSVLDNIESYYMEIT